jgi:hypothetical protein
MTTRNARRGDGCQGCLVESLLQVPHHVREIFLLLVANQEPNSKANHSHCAIPESATEAAHVSALCLLMYSPGSTLPLIPSATEAYVIWAQELGILLFLSGEL